MKIGLIIPDHSRRGFCLKLSNYQFFKDFYLCHANKTIIHNYQTKQDEYYSTLFNNILAGRLALMGGINDQRADSTILSQVAQIFFGAGR